MEQAPAPCQHIADYYQAQWTRRKCIAFNLLRHGYRQWAEGRVPDPVSNNLFASTSPPPINPGDNQ